MGAHLSEQGGGAEREGGRECESLKYTRLSMELDSRLDPRTVRSGLEVKPRVDI